MNLKNNIYYKHIDMNRYYNLVKDKIDNRDYVLLYSDDETNYINYRFQTDNTKQLIENDKSDDKNEQVK